MLLHVSQTSSRVSISVCVNLQVIMLEISAETFCHDGIPVINAS